MEIVMLRQAAEKGLAHPKDLELVGDPGSRGAVSLPETGYHQVGFHERSTEIFAETVYFRCIQTVKILSPAQCGEMRGMRKMCGKLPGSCN